MTCLWINCQAAVLRCCWPDEWVHVSTRSLGCPAAALLLSCCRAHSAFILRHPTRAHLPWPPAVASPGVRWHCGWQLQQQHPPASDLQAQHAPHNTTVNTAAPLGVSSRYAVSSTRPQQQGCNPLQPSLLNPAPDPLRKPTLLAAPATLDLQPHSPPSHPPTHPAITPPPASRPASYATHPMASPAAPSACPAG